VMRIVRDQQPVKRDRLLDLSPLGRQDTVDSVKSLYENSRIYLDSNQSYVSTKRLRLSRQAAWSSIIGRLFDDFGIMTAESLAMLLGHEIPMREIRRSLRQLEDDGRVVKGFMERGSGVLHWASNEAFGKLGRAEFNSTVVLSPGDFLNQYLRSSYRAVLAETGRHMIFRGTRLIGSFEGRISGGKLEVSDIKGEPGCDEVISEYAHVLGFSSADMQESRISDWEIMDFYRKTHPGVAGGKTK